MKSKIIFFLTVFCIHLNAQNLTISTSGQTGTSGTNWSLSSNVLTITGNADVNASVINNYLANNNLSFSGVSNFIINADIIWSSNKTLTLNASQNIFIYNNIAVGGDSAQLNLYYGGSNASTAPNSIYFYTMSQRNRNKISFTSTNCQLRIGNELYTICKTLNDLNLSLSNPTSTTKVALGASITLSQTYTNSLFPVTFAGKFDGLGNVIDKLKIRNSGGASTNSNLGLFSQLQGATIRNLGITTIDILTNSTQAGASGSEFRVGALAGNIGNSALTSGYSASAYTCTIESVWASGNIGTENNFSTDNQSSGDRQKFFFGGGLIGSINNGTTNISRCYSFVNVSTSGSYTDNLAIGGLIGDVGRNLNLLTPHIQSTNTEIALNLNKSYTTGSILSGNNGAYFGTGGLIGVLFVSGSTVSDCYSWGSAVSTGSFGGLIGFVVGGTISNCYTTQSVLGSLNTSTQTNLYTSVTATSPTSGTTLPTGFSSSSWMKVNGELPVLLDLESPLKILYVNVTTGQSSACGSLNVPYTITDAFGNAVNLATLGLSTPSGTPVFTINNFTPPGTYSGVSYLSGLTLTGTNAANYTLNPYPSTSQSHTITGSCVNYQIIFSGNGNTSGTAPANITFKTSSVIPDQGTLSRTGQKFLGWNTLANGTGTNYAVGATYSSLANVTLYAQWVDLSSLGCVTIVASGGSSENSGWVSTFNMIRPNSSSAVNINASDVNAKMANGDFIIGASCITVNSTIQNTTNTNSISFLATGNIDVKSNITTNGGNITFWSDYDNNGSGGIKVDDNVTIDSRTTTDRTNGTHTINGGKITFAGGLDDGGIASGTQLLTQGLVANDGFPDGYAVNSGSTATQTGIVLGTSTTSNGRNSNIAINSGGNEIRFHGLVTNNTSAPGNGPTGLMFFEGYNINSGNAGNIILLGNANLTSGSWAIGMDLAAWRTINNGYSGNATVRTVNGKINIIGRASGGTSGNIALAIDGGTNRHTYAATGSGSISVDGSASGNTPLDVRLTNVDLLSSSGDISLTSRGTSGISIGGYNIGDGLFIGQKSGSLVTSSTSNITITSNNLDLTNKPLVSNTSGGLIIEPLGTSFAANQTFSNQTIASTLSSLRIGKSGNTANIILGNKIAVAGPISLFGGNITINDSLSSSNGSTISIYSNTLNIASTKTIASSGQLVICPQTLSNSIGIAGASGTLNLPASFFNSNFADGFSNIQIGSSNCTGNISLNGFALRDNLTLLTSGSLTLGGKVEMGANNVILGNSFSTVSASSSGYFQTNGLGKTISVLGNNSNLTMPVGNSSYNPLIITNKTGASDTFSVSVVDSVYLNGTSSGLIKNPHVKRTWNLSKSIPSANAGSGVDLSFTWNANEVVGTLTSPTLNHHNGTNWEIPSMGTSSLSGTTLTYTGYKGSFSPFSIGGSSTVGLPVELLSFEANCKSEFNQINWTTASEKDNERFELYKSSDAIVWQKIYTVKGQATKATETNYSFNDMEKQSNYYRLKDVDFSGNETWSQIISSECGLDNAKTAIYPNPAKDYVDINSSNDENTSFNIIDLNGKALISGELTSTKTRLDITALSPGMYSVEIMEGNHKLCLKLIKR